MNKNYPLAILALLFFSISTSASSANLGEVIFSEDFEKKPEGWEVSRCSDGKCSLESIPAEENQDKAGGNIGKLTIIANNHDTGCSETDGIFVRNFKVDDPGQYKISFVAGSKSCSDCYASARLFINDTPVADADNGLQKIELVQYFSTGFQEIGLGIHTWKQCYGEFEAFWDEVKISKERDDITPDTNYLDKPGNKAWF